MKFLQKTRFRASTSMALGKRDLETQLIITVHGLAIGLGRRQHVDAILLDFSKAFDKVPHQRLAVNLPSQWHQRRKAILDPKLSRG